MKVVCQSRSGRFTRKLDTITPRDLAKRMGELTGAFAVVPPLTPASRHAVAEYVITNEVVAFVLFRELEGLDLARMLFGEFVRLARPTHVIGNVTSVSPAMQRYMADRKVRRIIQYMLPDPNVDVSVFDGPSEGDALFPEDARHARGDADQDVPDIQPLATSGASSNLCAASVKVGAGFAILAPLGKALDREGAGLLEQVAQRLLRQPGKQCLFLSWMDPDHPTLSVGDRDPVDLAPQAASVLTALYVGCGASTTADIWAAINDIASVSRKAKRKLTATDARAVDNRIQKANSLLKDARFGVPFSAVVSPGGRSGTRALDERINLVVTEIPRGPAGQSLRPKL